MNFDFDFGSESRAQNAPYTPCRATTASLSHTFIVINIHAIRHSGEMSKITHMYTSLK